MFYVYCPQYLYYKKEGKKLRQLYYLYCLYIRHDKTARSTCH